MSCQGTLQSRPPAGPILAALLACLLFMPVQAGAAEQVGRVLVAVGGVTAEQAETSARGLGRRDPIYAGDRIRTGARGRVQIRFEDGALVDLDPSSTFEVTEYDSDDESGGSAVMSFLKGAMRTITGAIGGNRGDEYRMNTTVATIGVRGTAYALEYCDAECAGDDGQTGLYGRVDEGEVEVDGPGGIGGFGAGQYFFVPDGGAPDRIVAPPGGILEGDGETGAGGGDDRIEDVSIRPLDTGEEDGAGIDGDENDLLDPDYESEEDRDLSAPRSGVVENVLFAGGFFGGEDGEETDSSFLLSPDDGEVRLESGAVIGAEFPSAGFVSVDTDAGTLSSGGTTLGSTGGPIDIDWGWWQGPIDLEADPEDGGNGTFVYAYTDPLDMTTTAQLNTLAGNSIQAGYGSGFAGTLDGPGGFDAEGGSWSVTSLGMQVDFFTTNVTLTSFNLDDGSTFLTMTGVTPSGSIDLASSSLTVSDLEDSDGSHTGGLSGRFLGEGAEGLLIRFDITGDDEITGVNIIGAAN